MQDTRRGEEAETGRREEVQTPQKTAERKRKISVTGMLLAGTFGAGAVALTLASIPFVTPAMRRVCIPYVPATTAQLTNVGLALGKRVMATAVAPIVDLGSGDGRVVLKCAQAGHRSVGVELNLILVLWSRLRARRYGLQRLASFERRDIFKTDLGKYRTAVIFGSELLMEDLVPKLDEMLEGSTLLACRFPLPSKNTRWKLICKVGEGIDSVWLYEKCPYIVISEDVKTV